MLSQPTIASRSGHPNFLDLNWKQSIVDWDSPRLVALPKGASRYEASPHIGAAIAWDAARRGWVDAGRPGFRPEPEASPGTP